jgi:hypothetical protein
MIQNVPINRIETYGTVHAMLAVQNNRRHDSGLRVKGPPDVCSMLGSIRPNVHEGEPHFRELEPDLQMLVRIYLRSD